MDLTQLTVVYTLGEFAVEGLPAEAANALESGFDSPSLRQLAAADSADTDWIRVLFTESMRELGIAMPSPPEAALMWARCIAREIVRGAIGPYEGATQIWRKIFTRFPSLTELRPFVGLASEYEDDPAHREDYCRLIVEESKALLATEKRGA